MSDVLCINTPFSQTQNTSLALLTRIGASCTALHLIAEAENSVRDNYEGDSLTASLMEPFRWVDDDSDLNLLKLLATP